MEPHESATMAWIVTRQSRLFSLHDKHSNASCKIISMNKTSTTTEIVNNQQTSSCLRLQSLQERLHGSRELMFSRMVTWTQPPPVCRKPDQSYGELLKGDYKHKDPRSSSEQALAARQHSPQILFWYQNEAAWSLLCLAWQWLQIRCRPKQIEYQYQKTERSTQKSTLSW